MCCYQTIRASCHLDHDVNMTRRQKPNIKGTYIRTLRHVKTIVVYSDTGWNGMGLKRRCWPKSPILWAFLILAALVQNCSSCAVDDCEPLYKSARSSDSPKEKCVTLRTYYECVKNKRPGCYSNIRYHSVLKVSERRLKNENCSKSGKIYETRRVIPTWWRNNHQTISECSFKGQSIYSHCGLFGDPHLRTFGSEFQTCKVRGAWPLVDNPYLTVQVTNAPVGKEGKATATSKLTVIIKKHKCGTSKYNTYQAWTNNLPNTFSDGRTAFGREGSVRVVEIQKSQHIEIHIKYIDTTILVRQIGHYFTFSIQMPKELLINMQNKTDSDESGLNLCINGCPKSEIIDYKHLLGQKHKHNEKEMIINGGMSRKEAMEKCKETKVVDFYFDSCVFDLITTGNSNFTKAANTAQQDVLRFNPVAGKALKNRTSLEIYEKAYSNSSSAKWTSRIFTWLVLLWTLLLVVAIR